MSPLLPGLHLERMVSVDLFVPLHQPIQGPSNLLLYICLASVRNKLRLHLFHWELKVVVKVSASLASPDVVVELHLTLNTETRMSLVGLASCLRVNLHPQRGGETSVHTHQCVRDRCLSCGSL